jgi:hypothetical protein
MIDLDALRRGIDGSEMDRENYVSWGASPEYLAQQKAVVSAARAYLAAVASPDQTDAAAQAIIAEGYNPALAQANGETG